ncbi:hypothetical protein KCG48_04905 [Proteiniclasticum sp. BAD-10]|uniref:Phage-related protein n=1 Tax=Proteiniclasticum sediminis TaxID=2804028 RepID=A0A941CPH4_9CLOT|nr:hypothetical protein [Proteiniclasticum sediminis]MBR0575679.1 hypothetical protein [Proteiniclasticum sediminis]
MAKKKIAGITVEIGGDSTKLDKAISKSSAKAGELQGELRGVESLLKLDPKNVELLAQKQTILNETIEETKKKLAILKDAQGQVQAQFDKGEITSDQYRDFQREIISTEQKLGKLEDQQKEFNETGGQVKKVADGMEDVGKGAKGAGTETLKLGDIIKANLISEAIIGGIKKIGGAIKGMVTGVFNIGKAAVESYAETQQLVGGVETIFKDSAKAVQEYANEAYKAAGITANDYMSQVTSFSASLLQSLNGDTAKAAQVADMAIIDMADNANKMGSNISDIQNAYQGFAKQNYTMLDNLKLGYGGTKTEMERLLKDATALSGVKYDINNLNDVYQAIHVVQTELGITGTTAKEASETISGSIGQMKSAYGNFISGLADENANLDELSQSLADSIKAVLSNLIPVIQRIAASLFDVLPALTDTIMELADELLPIFLEFIAQIIPKIADVLLREIGQIIETAWIIVDTLVTAIMDNLPALIAIGADLLTKIIGGITGMLPQLIAAGMTILLMLTQALMDNLPLILTAAITIIMMLAQGLTENLPTLIPAAIDALLTLVDSLVENIDMLIDAAIAIMMALADGLLKAMPQLLSKAPVIIAKLVEAISRNLPKLIEASVQIMVMLALGLVQAIPDLLKQIPTIITSLINAFKNYNYQTVGKAIIDGIKEGVLGAAAGLANAAKEVVDMAVKGVKKFLGIHSPATKLRDEVGKMMPQGIAVGIEADASKAVDAMDDLTAQVMDAGTPQMVNMMNGNPLVSPSTQLESVRSSLGDNGSLAGKIDSMIAILAQYLPHLENEMQLVMDTGAIVGAVAPGVNRELGKNSARRERGI